MSFNYNYHMRGVKSLAQITAEQIALADAIAIGVRVAACGFSLGVALLSGVKTATITGIIVFLAVCVLSLVIGIQLSRKKLTETLYLPSIIIDALAFLALAFSSLGAPSLTPALPTLVVLEGYLLSLMLLAGLRLALRDTLLAGGLATFAAALFAFSAHLRFPAGTTIYLFTVPFLNAVVAAIVTLTGQRSRAALRDNLVTEDHLRAGRRLTMTMDIVTASIFNLHQLINKLMDVATTVSVGARDQAGSIEKVTTAAEQLQASMESISQSTDRSAATIGRTAQFSESGNSIMKKVIGEILGIHEVVDKMVAALARINDIADQTNLLALNAAIEASRTGDEKSGFSVIADEIRKLAEKSAATASEVSKWVKQIESVILSGGESSRDAGKIFDTIARDLATFAGFIHDLSHSVKDQLGANREVTGAIEQIGSVVEDNRISADAVTRIIGDLKNEMLKLESLVGDKVQEAEKLYRQAQVTP